MAKVPLPLEQASRFPFFADAEMYLRDGTLVRAQVVELGPDACYLGALVPIPVRTELLLRISNGGTTCELPGRVVSVHSSDGLGLFGMDVSFGKMEAHARSILDAWLDKLSKRTQDSSSDQIQTK
jgi:hypothetical protein